MFYLLLLLHTHPAFRPYFQGEITYRYTYITQNPGIPQHELEKQMLRDSSIELYARDQYKSIFYKQSDFAASLTYSKSTRLVYKQSAGRDYITYGDSRKPNMPAYPSDIISDSTISVLGYSCHLVKAKNLYGDVYSFYADDLRLDPQKYEGHVIMVRKAQAKQGEHCPQNHQHLSRLY